MLCNSLSSVQCSVLKPALLMSSLMAAVSSCRLCSKKVGSSPKPNKIWGQCFESRTYQDVLLVGICCLCWVILSQLLYSPRHGNTEVVHVQSGLESIQMSHHPTLGGLWQTRPATNSVDAVACPIFAARGPATRSRHILEGVHELDMCHTRHPQEELAWALHLAMSVVREQA